MKVVKNNIKLKRERMAECAEIISMSSRYFSTPSQLREFGYKFNTLTTVRDSDGIFILKNLVHTSPIYALEQGLSYSYYSDWSNIITKVIEKISPMGLQRIELLTELWIDIESKVYGFYCGGYNGKECLHNILYMFKTIIDKIPAQWMTSYFLGELPGQQGRKSESEYNLWKLLSGPSKWYYVNNVYVIIEVAKLFEIEIHETRKKNKDIQASLTTMTREKEAMETRLTTIMTEREAIGTKITAITTEKEAMKARLTAITTEKEAMETKLSGLYTDIVIMEARLTAEKKEKEEMETELRAIIIREREAMEAIKTEKEEVEERLKNITREREEYKERMTEKEIENKRMMEEMERMKIKQESQMMEREEMMTRLVEKTKEETDEEVLKFKMMVEMIKKGKERKIIEMIGLIEEEIFSMTDGKGRTILMWSCVKGMEEVIKYLIARMRKEDIRMRDIYGKTALTYLLENDENPMPKICVIIAKKISWDTEERQEIVMPAMPEEVSAIPEEMPEIPMSVMPVMPAMPEEVPVMPAMPAMPEEVPAMPEEVPAMPEEKEEDVMETTRGDEGEDESEIEQRMIAVKKMERMMSESEGEKVRKARRKREEEMEKRMEEMKRVIESGMIIMAKNMIMMSVNKELMNYIARDGETLLYYVMRRRMGVGIVEAALTNMRMDVLKRRIYAGMTAVEYAAELGEEMERVVKRRLIQYTIKSEVKK